MKEITCKITCEITVIQNHEQMNYLVNDVSHAEYIRNALGANNVNVTNLQYSIRDLHPQLYTEAVEMHRNCSRCSRCCSR